MEAAPSDVRKVLIEYKKNEMKERNNKDNNTIEKQYNKDNLKKNDNPSFKKPSETQAIVKTLQASYENGTDEERAAVDNYLDSQYDSDHEVHIRNTRTICYDSSFSHVFKSGTNVNRKGTSIFDGGADTTLFDDSWHILGVDPFRTANVIGYDKNLPGRNKLPIVTGLAAFDHPSNGKTYLLRHHEGIMNKFGDLTCVSTPQIRSYGIKVDDVPLSQGGKQCITLLDGS